MSKAYLVVHLDTEARPPRVLGCGVYSEPARSLTGAIGNGGHALDVLDAPGADYEDALRNLAKVREFYRESGVFEWAFRMLPAGSFRDAEVVPIAANEIGGAR
jgi:hypothetical protein